MVVIQTRNNVKLANSLACGMPSKGTYYYQFSTRDFPSYAFFFFVISDLGQPYSSRKIVELTEISLGSGAHSTRKAGLDCII